MNSLILLSGGLDSAVSLGIAVDKTQVKLALTFDYGQRAAAREIIAAKNLAEYYQLPHRVLTFPWLGEITKTALVDPLVELPELAAADFERPDRLQETADAVWVPNRNGVFINAAACLAEAIDCELIICGFNAEEAATFPDNTAAFVVAINQSLAFSTRGRVKVTSFVQDLTKVEIIKVGRDLGVPLKYIWSCYRGESAMCGHCESCQRLWRACIAAGYVPAELFNFRRDDR
ncbi:MAG: 7-cyano-7-deazaguanine synthase QueC [Firmicutes bacterium]|nr:7-cyano-7-deazaguanine synthase QueC [Bacillota bacterium]